MLLPTLNKEGAMAEAESTDESSTLLGTAILPESAGSKKPSCQPSDSFVVVPPPP
jgi:hypothetical protein